MFTTHTFSPGHGTGKMLAYITRLWMPWPEPICPILGSKWHNTPELLVMVRYELSYHTPWDT